VPQQDNGSDCGLFVLSHAEFFLHGALVALAAAWGAAPPQALPSKQAGAGAQQQQGEQQQLEALAQVEAAVTALAPKAEQQQQQHQHQQGQQGQGHAPAGAFLAIDVAAVRDEDSAVGGARGFLRPGWFSKLNAAALRDEILHLAQRRMLDQALDRWAQGGGPGGG
jgi:Ulp1 family protease